MDTNTNKSIERQLSEFFASSAYSVKRKSLLHELTGATGQLTVSLERLEKSYTSAIPEFRGGMSLDCEMLSDPTVKLRILIPKGDNHKLKGGRGLDTVKAKVKFVRWLNSYDRFLVTVIDGSISLKPRHKIDDAAKSLDVGTAILESNETQQETDLSKPQDHLTNSLETTSDTTPHSIPSTESDNPTTDQHTDDLTNDGTANAELLSYEDFNSQVAEESETDVKNISSATDLVWKLLLNPLAIGAGITSLNVPGIGQITVKKDGALAELSIDRSGQPNEWEVHSFDEVAAMAPRKRNALEKRALKLSLDLNDTLGIARGDAFSIAAATMRLTNDLLGRDIGIELPDRKSLQRKVIGDTSQFVVHGAQSLFQRVADSIVNILDKPGTTTDQS